MTFHVFSRFKKVCFRYSSWSALKDPRYFVGTAKIAIAYSSLGLFRMSAPTSIELWASSKIIGRECATVNKDYFVCKKGSQNPADCETQSTLASLCAIKVVDSVKVQFPTEFQAFAKCLNYNDFRYNDCRKEERALLDCINKKNGAI